MKSGTTSLYDDLAWHSGVHAPDMKEPSILVRDNGSSAAERSYRAHFKSARPDQVLLDGSTLYTMLPENRGAAELASSVFASSPLIVYIVREPFGRIRSAYMHNYRDGVKLPSFKQAIRTKNSGLINYTSYYTQISPWIEQFGLDRVRILTMDYWRANRVSVAASLWQAAGLDVSTLPNGLATVKNDATRKRLHPEVYRLMRNTVGADWDSKVIKYIPKPVRRLASRMLSVAPPLVEASYSEEDFEFVWAHLADQLEQMAPLIGHAIEDATTIWSRQDLAAKYLK